MPAAIAERIECGMPATSQRRTPVTVRIRKMQPEMNTAPSACCQVKPMRADHGEGEEGVQPHARRHRDRPVGVERHDRRAERRGEAGRDEHRALVHAGRGEDLRVDEDDVGHRQERRDPGDHLGAHVGAVFLQLEVALEHSSSRSRWRPMSRSLADGLVFVAQSSFAAVASSGVCAASRAMISAATSAAITAGRLSPDGPPIGQVSPAQRRAARGAAARPPGGEARPLRRRADQPDVGRVAARRAPRRRSGSRARGRGSAPRRPRPAAAAATSASGSGDSRVSTPGGRQRQFLGALVDQDRAHRQQRQRRGQRPADVAGAEDQRLRAGRGRFGVEPAAQRRGEAAVDRGQRQRHPPAAALADLGAERHVHALGRRARGAAAARAWSIAMYSSWPPPMVPATAAAPTSIQAPASRGAEPTTADDLDEDGRLGRVEQRERVAATSAQAPASARSRSIVVSTRSGVAGASMRGAMR